MIDRLVLHIPVKEHHVTIRDDYCLLNFDLMDLGVKTVGELYKDENGQVRWSDVRTCYEKLPTSNTDMSFKFYYDVYGQIPYVELKASPAKIMQGHNLYGSDYILMGALEMLGFLALDNPNLYKMLNVKKTEVKAIDITYSAQLKNNQQVEKALDYLRNVSTQHIRKSQKIHANTVYFGSERCKRFGRKVYGKFEEFMHQLKEKEKLAKQGDKRAEQIVNVMRSPKLQMWAFGRLRFETTVKAYALKELGYPTNLIELLKYQREHNDFLKQIWIKANQQLFDALKGVEMNIANYDEVHKKLCLAYATQTASGRVSYTKADNLFNFYRTLEMDGIEEAKARFSKSKFHRLMQELQGAGFSKAYLQNLHTNKKDNVKTFVELINVDFESQVPSDWEEPRSTFFPEYRALLQLDEVSNDDFYHSVA